MVVVVVVLGGVCDEVSEISWFSGDCGGGGSSGGLQVMNVIWGQGLL